MKIKDYQIGAWTNYQLNSSDIPMLQLRFQLSPELSISRISLLHWPHASSLLPFVQGQIFAEFLLLKRKISQWKFEMKISMNFQPTFQCQYFRNRIHECRIRTDRSSQQVIRICNIHYHYLGRVTNSFSNNNVLIRFQSNIGKIDVGRVYTRFLQLKYVIFCLMPSFFLPKKALEVGLELWWTYLARNKFSKRGEK